MVVPRVHHTILPTQPAIASSLQQLVMKDSNFSDNLFRPWIEKSFIYRIILTTVFKTAAYLMSTDSGKLLS